MDVTNLNSLKVTDLKQLLKARGLSIVGVKSELIQRLEAAMLTAPSGVAAGTAKAIEKEIDEDAILAGDDESFTKPDESLLNSEDLLLNESNIVSPRASLNASVAAKATPIPSAQPTVANSTTTNVTSNPTKPEVSTESHKTTDKNTVSTLKQLASAKNILSPEEKKQLRMLKFADPKLKNRAERFGVEVAKPEAVVETAKILQRAQRFGEVISSKAKTIDEKERLNKRKERFGLVAETTTNSSNGFKATSTPVANEKIQKRQERFGVVESNSAKAQSGFKRRRFAN